MVTTKCLVFLGARLFFVVSEPGEGNIKDFAIFRKSFEIWLGFLLRAEYKFSLFN